MLRPCSRSSQASRTRAGFCGSTGTGRSSRGSSSRCSIPIGPSAAPSPAGSPTAIATSESWRWGATRGSVRATRPRWPSPSMIPSRAAASGPACSNGSRAGLGQPASPSSSPTSWPRTPSRSACSPTPDSSSCARSRAARSSCDFRSPRRAPSRHASRSGITPPSSPRCVRSSRRGQWPSSAHRASVARSGASSFATSSTPTLRAPHSPSI